MTDSLLIIDYGAGNIKSIINMLKCLEVPYLVSSSRQDILKAKRIIFPGQGHFKQAMEKLNSKDLKGPIYEAVSSGIPFLGVCLGFQILFEKSEEAPNVEGLGLLKGEVVKFLSGKTPQIGWNLLETTKNNSYLNDDYFYFVNSYYVKPEDSNIISAYANYGIKFAASVESKNIVGVQFHPEKSSKAGLKFFKKWLNKP